VRASAHFCWIDGRLTPKREAKISVTDLAFTRGYAGFEALRTYGRIPFLLDAHLDRLVRTCGHLGLKVPVSRRTIAAGVQAALEANGFEESVIRIYITGGEAPGFVPAGNERWLALVDPLHPYPATFYRKGIALATSRLQRSLPAAKSIDYVVGVRETMRARAAGAHEVIFLDRRERILEGTTFNVIGVRKRELLIAGEGVLPGITLRIRWNWRHARVSR
jgi:branched-subunit amino acid aminotransferase/4-amino-4-deoxychorismate lyase